MRKLAVAAGVLAFCGAIWFLIVWRRSSARDAAVADAREQVAVIDSEVQGLDFDWNSSACEPKDAALYADVLRRKGDAALSISRARDLLGGDDPRSAGLDRALGRIDDQLAVKKNRCLQVRSAAGSLR